MSKYFDKLMNFKDKTFKEQALIDGVPIIKDESLKLIIFLLKNKVNTIKCLLCKHFSFFYCILF